MTAYLDALFAVENVAEPALAGVPVADLVASVLRPEPAGDEPGPRRDRVQSILDAIARQASDPELDPARLAEPLGLSVRYLQGVLEDTGRTFSQYLWHEQKPDQRRGAELRLCRFVPLQSQLSPPFQ